MHTLASIRSQHSSASSISTSFLFQINLPDGTATCRPRKVHGTTPYRYGVWNLCPRIRDMQSSKQSYHVTPKGTFHKNLSPPDMPGDQWHHYFVWHLGLFPARLDQKNKDSYPYIMGIDVRILFHLFQPTTISSTLHNDCIVEPHSE